VIEKCVIKSPLKLRRKNSGVKCGKFPSNYIVKQTMKRIFLIVLALCPAVNAQCYIEKPLSLSDLADFKKHLIKGGASNEEIDKRIHSIHGSFYEGTGYKSVEVFTRPKKSSDQICFIEQFNYYKNEPGAWKASDLAKKQQKVMVVKINEKCPASFNPEQLIYVENITDFDIVKIMKELPSIKKEAATLLNKENYGVNLLNEGGYKLNSISTTEREEGKPAGYELKFDNEERCGSMPIIRIYEKEKGFKVVSVNLLMV
jgi:hypothetical protein